MRDSKPFTRNQIQQTVQELDQLSVKEYGIGLVEVMEGIDCDLAPRRLRRLAGIVLKSKFADKGERPESSETKALRCWIWHQPEQLDIVPKGAGAEHAILNQLREYLPKYKAHLAPTWQDLQYEAEHESGLFKVLIMWTKDKIEKRNTKPFEVYFDTPVDRRLQALMDIGDVLFNAAIAPVYASVIPAAGLVVPITLIGLKYGYRELMGPDNEMDIEN